MYTFARPANSQRGGIVAGTRWLRCAEKNAQNAYMCMRVVAMNASNAVARVPTHRSSVEQQSVIDLMDSTKHKREEHTLR